MKIAIKVDKGLTPWIFDHRSKMHLRWTPPWGFFCKTDSTRSIDFQHQTYIPKMKLTPKRNRSLDNHGWQNGHGKITSNVRSGSLFQTLFMIRGSGSHNVQSNILPTPSIVGAMDPQITSTSVGPPKKSISSGCAVSICVLYTSLCPWKILFK